MTSKKKTSTSPSTSPQTLKIGSRVRCDDVRVEGRIVWANAVSVKIRWSDGEQVTWRRDSLADRPIEIVEGSEDQSTAAMDSTTLEPTEQIELPPIEMEEVPTTPVAEASPLHPAPSIVWANAVSLKIRWNDGEQVTWRRDSLADCLAVLGPAEVTVLSSTEQCIGVLL